MWHQSTRSSSERSLAVNRSRRPPPSVSAKPTRPTPGKADRSVSRLRAMSSIPEAPTRASPSRERCPSGARGSPANTASGTGPHDKRARALRRGFELRGSHNGAVAESQGTPVVPPRGGARRAAEPKRSVQPRLLGLGLAALVALAVWGLLVWVADRLGPRRPWRRVGQVGPPRGRLGRRGPLPVPRPLAVHGAAAPGRDPRGEPAEGEDRAPALEVSDLVSTISAPPDELQPGPGLVDRRDLDVDEPELEAEGAHLVVVEVTDRAVGVARGPLGCLLGPADPDHARGRGVLEELGQPLARAAYDVWKVRLMSAAWGRRRTS